ncbi:MAG: transcriptional regulator NrdR [Candidatus Nanohaloarchaea archaeon]|nr:transcriptional regulator NrdR [Candidatus Nanohaloarchaea archaeon]
MKCPYCAGSTTKVVDTRGKESSEVRRRRECNDCGKRFTTYERVGNETLTIVKSDGSEESFSREKLKKGIDRACNKRPVTEEEIEQLVDNVESRLRALDSDKVDSDHIGDLVMEELRELDEVAYIRFASVYESFETADSFEEEVKELKHSS